MNDGFTLFVALKEYLCCLEKYVVDAEEEASLPGRQMGQLQAQWRAKGEAGELPKITARLAALVGRHNSSEKEAYILLWENRVCSGLY